MKVIVNNTFSPDSLLFLESAKLGDHLFMCIKSWPIKILASILVDNLSGASPAHLAF